MNWDDVRVFLAVARTGSLSAAAVVVASGVATVSRRVERLEAAIRVPLFQRHQTGYRLTDQGRALLSRAEAVESAVVGMGIDAQAEAAVAGQVRLATAENLANPIVIPSLAPLLDRYKQLAVEVVTDVATANLHRRDADLALRLAKPERGHLTVRRVGTLGFGLYGARAYVAARTPDGEATPFAHDRFIGWTEALSGLPAARWLERTLQGRAPVLTTTTLAAQLSAARAGLGLAILPHFLAIEAGLEPVGAALGIDQPIWLVVHTDLRASKRVDVVAKHLASLMRDQALRLQFGRSV